MDSTPVLHVYGLVHQDRIRAPEVARNPMVAEVTPEKGPSPIRVSVLEALLCAHPSREEAS